jgi:hypothetical protein
MSYINLPPGRRRMLAYSNYIRNRSRLSVSPIQTFRYNRNFTDAIFLNYEYLTTLENVKIGLINKKILSNTKVSINSNNEEFCVICQDKINKNKIIRTLKCQHSFDLDCIDNWFIENKKCPTCNTEI